MHPTNVVEINKTSALSFVPSGVLLIEDVYSFIQCKLEDLGDKFIHDEFKGFYNNGLLKAEHMHLQSKGLSYVVDIPNQVHVNQIIYVLSRVHDYFLWMEAEALIKITKDVMRRVTGFNETGKTLTLRTISSNEVTQLTKS